MPPNTLKVDRSTQWGNEFLVSDCGSPARAVELFEHDLDKFECFHPDKFELWILPLRGKNLACWCPIGSPCHADVLLGVAARPASKNETVDKQVEGESA